MERRKNMDARDVALYGLLIALASYVLHHQTTGGLINAEGYAMDAVSSVSINAYPFVNGLSDCLDQAAIR